MLYFAFSPKRDKVKSVKANGRTIEDNFATRSFLRAESAYRHQICMMHRYDYGEGVLLGDIVDFLVGKDTAKHLTGLSICATGNEEVEPEQHEYISDTTIIKEENLLSFVADKDATGKVKALRKRNSTLTLLRDNGKPIVLFVRNMVETPYLHYIRIYSMTLNENCYEIHGNSTLICCKVTDNKIDINKHLDFYQRVEEDVKNLIQQGLPLKNNFQYLILEGKYGGKPISAYIRNGNFYFSQNRYVDAFRQYDRALKDLESLKENTISNTDACNLYYKTGICLMKIGSTLRSYYYIDKACHYDASLKVQRLAILAGLADHRTMPMLNELKGKIPENSWQDIFCTYKGCCDAREKFLKKCPNYMTISMVLQYLSLALQNNICAMTISRYTGKEYKQETIKDAEQVWNYPLSELLQDNNTIVISYSLTGEQYGAKGDLSKLCPDNSIIMQVSGIEENSSIVRVDIMIPAFVYDPDKFSVTKDYLQEYKSFLIAKSPIEFDFQSLSLYEIMSISSDLCIGGRIIEALFGATYAFTQLSAHCDDSNEIDRAKKIIGYCFRELGFYDKAEYYLSPN